MKREKKCVTGFWLLYSIPLILLLLFSNTLSAQRKLSKSNFITRFPFRVLEGGVVIFKATIDNHPDSLTFILDTGNGGISLDSSTVSTLGLHVQASDRILRGIGSMKKLSYTYDRTLRMPGLSVDHLDFHINDYELLTSANGIKIDGIVGFSLLKRYIIFIDYDHFYLEFYQPGTIKYPKGGYYLRSDVTGIPLLSAVLEDGTICKSNFYFDTGAGLCLLMSDRFESDSNILIKGKKLILTQAEGIGKKTMKITTVKKIRIGPYRFRKVPAHTFEDEYNVTNYPKTGGLIGNDLLRRFNLILNYRDSIIHLKPNSHFKDPFDYSYTGLSLYLLHGLVVVEEVMANSPGEKAGIIPGDIIVSIENNFTGNLQAYKQLLQAVNTRKKVNVNRGGELFTFYVNVESILKK